MAWWLSCPPCLVLALSRVQLLQGPYKAEGPWPMRLTDSNWIRQWELELDELKLPILVTYQDTR